LTDSAKTNLLSREHHRSVARVNARIFNVFADAVLYTSPF
jgi:hypothetical protein